MLKKLNKLFWIMITFSLLSLIAGVLLVWFPSVSLKVISYVIAAVMLLFGIILVTDYKARIFYTEFITLGVLFIILGSVLLLHNNIVQLIIPIIIGTYIIVNEIVNMRIALKLMKYSNSMIFAFILSLLATICGVLMIVYPSNSAIALTLYMGIVLIVYSISVLTNMIIFKKHVSDIKKIITE